MVEGDNVAKCYICGAETPLALRLPGRWSELPPDKRGRLPYCRDHEADAFARRAAKICTGGASAARDTGGAMAGGTKAPGYAGDAQAGKRNARKRGVNPNQGGLFE